MSAAQSDSLILRTVSNLPELGEAGAAADALAHRLRAAVAEIAATYAAIDAFVMQDVRPRWSDEEWTDALVRASRAKPRPEMAGAAP